jgi:type IV secretion system protein TrbI
VTDNETNRDNEPESTQPSLDELAQSFRLRPERPRVARLSRKVLVGGAAFILVAICGAVLWALQANRVRPPAPDELYSTDRRTIADGLAGLPKNYTGIPRDVPKLGPPLPGDLGRPIVAAQGQSGALAVDAEQQRTNQESEAARTSRVFVPTSVRSNPASAAHPSAEAGSVSL